MGLSPPRRRLLSRQHDHACTAASCARRAAACWTTVQPRSAPLKHDPDAPDGGHQAATRGQRCWPTTTSIECTAGTLILEGLYTILWKNRPPAELALDFFDALTQCGYSYKGGQRFGYTNVTNCAAAA